MNDIPCGRCWYFNEEWSDCGRYCMHVDSDEIREMCRDAQEVLE